MSVVNGPSQVRPQTLRSVTLEGIKSVPGGTAGIFVDEAVGRKMPLIAKRSIPLPRMIFRRHSIDTSTNSKRTSSDGVAFPDSTQPETTWQCSQCRYSNNELGLVCALCGRRQHDEPGAPMMVTDDEHSLSSKSISSGNSSQVLTPRIQSTSSVLPPTQLPTAQCGRQSTFVPINPFEDRSLGSPFTTTAIDVFTSPFVDVQRQSPRRTRSVDEVMPLACSSPYRQSSIPLTVRAPTSSLKSYHRDDYPPQSRFEEETGVEGNHHGFKTKYLDENELAVLSSSGDIPTSAVSGNRSRLGDEPTYTILTRPALAGTCSMLPSLIDLLLRTEGGK